MNQLVPIAAHAPALIAAAGERAQTRFWEFFVSNIRNPNTRRAYARAAVEFFDWLAARGVTRLTAVESVHVAAYIEQLQKARSTPTAKLRLAALRHLFDWMMIGQIMPVNPPIGLHDCSQRTRDRWGSVRRQARTQPTGRHRVLIRLSQRHPSPSKRGTGCLVSLPFKPLHRCIAMILMG
jgi:hypothetical protein